jgi:hypothetical protein
MNELISDDKYIFINTEYAEAYIPEDIVGDIDKSPSTICYEYGNGYMTMGIFYMKFFDDENKRDSIPYKTLMYPNMIETHPSSVVMRTINIDGTPEKYRVLKYNKGDILMNTYSTQSPDNCKRFLNLIISGKIPRSLEYTQIFECWRENFAINDIAPTVPAVVLQAIISKMCRDKEDLSVEYRHIAGKGQYDKHGYQAINMDKVSTYSSVITALSFERFTDKLTTSINMTKENTKQDQSPIEKIVCY